MKKISLKDAVACLGGYTQYAQRLVQILKMYEPNAEKATTTLEYAFKGQNPSKLPIPNSVMPKLSFQSDDEGKVYMAVDNTYVKIVTENNWKRLVLVEKENSVNEVE